MSFFQKFASVLLVLLSLTAGLVGAVLVSAGDLWGIALLVLAPVGVFVASRMAPEQGSSGYCDKNL